MLCAASPVWEEAFPPPPPPPAQSPPVFEHHRQLYAAPPFWLDHGLPPFAPGAMPPVPGPVFSKAFNALLVLLVLGCIFLGLNLRDAINKMQESDIGLDNEILTKDAGNAKWLASIQKSQGRRAGHHNSAPAACGGQPKAKGSKKARAPVDSDEEAAEMETFVKPKPSKKKGKEKKGGR